jgi:serine/threonine-protein kinase
MSAAAGKWQQLLGERAREGDIVDDKYRLDRIIGSGAMGVVIEAWHVRFDEHVALKVLTLEAAANEETRLRFESEARAAFKIKSEHVARVIDVGALPEGSPYMVMEYLDGSDLAQVLFKERRFEVQEAVDHMLQVCAGVGEAHALGIVHRDLKPENLFLVHARDGTPCIKVLDFGISKVIGSSGVRVRAITNTSVTMGTPHYMSPEQWQSARDVTVAADFWAIGIILYELLAGRPPFDAPELGDLCTMVLTRDPPSLRARRAEVPEELEAVIRRCLERDPAKRFESAAQLARALVPFASSRGRTAARRIAGMREVDVPTSSDQVEQLPPITALHPVAQPKLTQPAGPAIKREMTLPSVPFDARTEQLTVRMDSPVGEAHRAAMPQPFPRTLLSSRAMIGVGLAGLVVVGALATIGILQVVAPRDAASASAEPPPPVRESPAPAPGKEESQLRVPVPVAAASSVPAPAPASAERPKASASSRREREAPPAASSGGRKRPPPESTPSVSAPPPVPRKENPDDLLEKF